jgi:hypothetical protein
MDLDMNLTSSVMLKVNLPHSVHFPMDMAWNRRISYLVTGRFRLEESLAWLSTLGGAYSCLGEIDLSCALRAGEISVKQLQLACVSGDPGLMARCALYRVYSLCQREMKREARVLIKEGIHPFISNMIVNKCCDNILKNMYRAACYRVKYQPFPVKVK